MDPWPGCHTLLEGNPLKVWSVLPFEETEGEGVSGEVTNVSEDGLIIRVGGGAVRIEEVQVSGGKRMSSADFLRGHAVRPGAVLGE